MPSGTEIRRHRGLSLEIQQVPFGLGVVGASAHLLQQRKWTESRIFAARCPDQVAKGLEAIVALDHVDPISRLEASRHGEDLVRGEVEGVESEAEFVVLDQWEEPERGVLHPLDQRGLQSRAAGYVALPLLPVPGKETTNASLEWCKSHSLSLLARWNSSRRP